ncbi:hypothetical protein KP509_09G020700 [Ceratopteris richardii]|uniref:Glycosyl transferase 64 domain-containing protein n=1 Tax=Ceratopteris richardii TaxID=49495 RepID=A0A8T2U2V4_CERRI|nr:hypothetical protein KP509_09G020700 [Ceratopteris richardii]KAH7428868.1 hypothetical protein KP509_09G020700 [Ceratopteris richardii]KAH7428869.1 hypothetical protein KP509_09G020700 [Ceratopteris richardii]KAH7428870.1 hypothetical protein KP509_09G020700 [Ceratopteris richardii]
MGYLHRDCKSKALPIGCCDMSVKCRCRWNLGHTWCSFLWQHPSCLLSSTLTFFISSFVIFAALGFLFSWLVFPPFSQPFLDSAGVGCQPDNEGSWSVGLFLGDNPLLLQPIEEVGIQKNRSSAWPVANPILTCASVIDASYPSNFVADPFLFIQGSTLYVFFESKNALTKQGDIGVAQSLDGGASWKYLGIALDEEWHLSYPFVFIYNNEIYMMPEGSAKGDLRLYRALQFPLIWTLDRVLIRRPLVDATMIEYNGKYWIFGSDFQRFGVKKNGELEIWYASTPLGPFMQHKGNPVRNEDRSLGARNGGRPFIYDGQLYRVGQDCGETYGRRLHLFRVEILTKHKFHEVEVPLGVAESRKGRNAWNGLRYHHLDAQRLPSGGWIAVMDGDRVPSGDINTRYLTGTAAFVFLVFLVSFVGVILGVVQFVFPFSKWLDASKRNDMALGYVRSQFKSKFHRALSQLNRATSTVRGRILFHSCGGASLMLLCFVLGIISVCIGVRSFFGGNRAEEPYIVGGQYSQFTLIAMTYEARLWNLQMYVKHYSRCASVKEILVIWNKGQPPNPDTDFDSAVPVRIRLEEKNSLNNRFKPDPLIKTRAVLELDDDILMTCDDLERAFSAWRQHPERIVGFYPRLVNGNPLKYRNEWYARANKGYNMILTGAAFIDSQTAFPMYWSEKAEEGRALVDKLFNCEDILLNYIIANSTTSRTVEYIHPAWAIDTSKLSSAAISRDTNSHYMKRTQCLLEFSKLYGTSLLQIWEFGTRSDGWDY